MPFDVNQTIKAVVSLLEHSIDKNILLDTSLQARDTQISGDPSLLQSALLNLGINARDALPGGGRVTIATQNLELDYEFCLLHAFQIDPGPFLEISVSDTGTGIAKEDLEHIFEPFFTTKGVGEGTGLEGTGRRQQRAGPRNHLQAVSAACRGGGPGDRPQKRSPPGFGGRTAGGRRAAVA